MTGSVDADRPRHAVPRLHVVTDDEVLARADILDAATRVLEAGGADLAFHVRGPATGGARLHALVVTLGATADSVGALLLVNDRVDVALTAGARGVHLGRRSLPVAEARRLLGRSACIGVSTHTPEEVATAASDGADFVFVGTVYETPTHPGRPGGGPQVVSAARAVEPDLPLVAIGGLNVERTQEVLRAGAHGIALIRGIWNERGPEGAVRRYLQVLEAGRPTRDDEHGTPGETNEARERDR